MNAGIISFVAVALVSAGIAEAVARFSAPIRNGLLLFGAGVVEFCGFAGLVALAHALGGIDAASGALMGVIVGGVVVPFVLS